MSETLIDPILRSDDALPDLVANADNCVGIDDSREDDEFRNPFEGISYCLSSSIKLGWTGVVVERRSVVAGETPEILPYHHFVILWNMKSTRGERVDRRGRFAPFSKHPNTLSTGLPGILPVV